MARSPGKRGTFGDWLKTNRERRYRTQTDALAGYRKLVGLVIAPSEYAQWESGSRVPKPNNPKRLALYDFYGSREDEPAAPTADGDLAALIASNLRLAAAIEEQNRLSRDQIAELRIGVDDLRAKVAELVMGTGDRVQDLTRRVTILETRVPPPLRGARASRGNAGRSSSSGAGP